MTTAEKQRKNTMDGKWAIILSFGLAFAFPAEYYHRFSMYWWIAAFMLFLSVTACIVFLKSEIPQAIKIKNNLQLFFLSYEKPEEREKKKTAMNTLGWWVTLYLLFLTVTLGLFAMISCLYFTRDFWFICFIYLGVLSLITYKGIKSVVLHSINENVRILAENKTKAETNPTLPVNPETLVSHTSAIENRNSTRVAQLHFEIIKADKFPEVSAQAAQHFEELHLRFQSLINLYMRQILVLALLVMLLTGVSNNWIKAFHVPFLKTVYGFTFFFTAFWIFFHTIAAPLIIKYVNHRTNNSKEYAQATHMAKRLKPNITPLLGILWCMLAIGYGIELFLNSQKPGALVLAGLLVALVTWYFFSVRRQQRMLEEKYPLYAPHKLLLLRVFGSNSIKDFMALIGAWRWMGTTYFLGGPDTAGEKMDELLNFLKGRIQDSIIENEEELNKEIANVQSLPDRHLRFPVHSMQCSNNIWHKALQHFLTKAEVIVIDLSGMSKTNLGIRYELEKIFNELPLQKVIFLINDFTDKEALFGLLQDIASTLPAQSPNYSQTQLNIRLFHYGGSLKMQPGETTEAWKLRIGQRALEKNIVCMILDTASKQAPTRPYQTKPSYPWAKWTWKDLRLNFMGNAVILPDENGQ